VIEMSIPVIDPNAPPFTKKYINLANAQLGAKGINCSDEFFAPLQRMLNPEPSVFIPGKYDLNGKWMDGWETRRKRSNGNDWSIIQLFKPGIIRGFDVDTSHFTGNFAPAVAIHGCFENDEPNDQTQWFEILPPKTLQGNQHHYFEIKPSNKVNYLKITIFPDGGIARLRVYGKPLVNWDKISPSEPLDFASAENGAYVISTNNEHFGLASNLLKPSRGENMGDGWETRRRREPGYDWCLIALAGPVNVQKIEIDTHHFKGNFPDQCSIQGFLVEGGTDESIVTQCMFWPFILPAQKLQMDHQHFYTTELELNAPISHLRLNIFPDGGVSRLRVWGTKP
jgi:allantoicase